MLSLLVLFGAWGGPAVAQRLFTGKDIKDRSLTGAEFKGNTLTGRVVGNLSGRDVRRDSLDGTDINEATLGEIPRAREAGIAERAGTATRADTAGAVDGLSVLRIFFAKPANNEAVALETTPLRLRARCSATGALTVTAVNTGDGGFLRASATIGPSGQSSPQPFYLEDDDFRPGEEIAVLPDGTDNASGQIVATSLTGSTVTVTFLAEQGIAAGRGIACLFSGTAVRVAP